MILGPTVIKLGGATLDDPAALAGVCEGVAAAHESGMAIVVVHGGGAAVDRRLESLGMTPAKRDGVRITPQEQIGVVAGVLAGEENLRLVLALRGAGVPAAGLRLADFGVADAECIGGDLGRVGRVTGGDGRTVTALLAAGVVPVIAPIACDHDGLLNVNADTAAAGVACSIGAGRLALLTDVPGVLDSSGELIAELQEDRAEALIADGVISGGMVPKVRGAIEASAVLGGPVLLASARDPRSIASDADTRAGTLVLARDTRRRPSASGSGAVRLTI